MFASLAMFTNGGVKRIVSDKVNRFRRTAIQVQEAQRRIMAEAQFADIETVGIEESLGRRLAEDVKAPHAVPHFRRSGMDGYAVMAADVVEASSDHPVILEVIENIPCGAVPARRVTEGTASRIMTGAMLPDGADVVIMLEATETLEQHGKANVAIKKGQPSGTNVTPIALELAEGDFVMGRGSSIHAGETALLASFGYSSVTVYRQPKVAILATGTELLEVDAPLQPGRIRNSNTWMLAAQVREAGGIPLVMGAIPDNVGMAKQKLDEAFAAADLVITTGGVSVGDYDILVDVFAEWEGKMLFNKLAMRPGSPTTVGVWKGKLLFALSGNPGASFVGFELLARPVIDGMQGVADPLPQLSTAYLAEDFTKVNAFTRYVRAVSIVRNGQVYVKPAGMEQSGIMLSIKDTDCLIIIPPGGQPVRAGELVNIIKLR